MNKPRLALIGLVALGLWTATVYGGPRHGMGSMGPGHMMMGDGPGMMLPMVLKGIDLTEAQEKQVRTIMQTHRATLRTLFGELKTAQEEVADTLFAPGEVRAEDLTNQLQRVSQLREQLMREGLKVALEVRGILTPEQIAKGAEIKARMRSLHSEMRGLFHDKK